MSSLKSISTIRFAGGGWARRRSTAHGAEASGSAWVTASKAIDVDLPLTGPLGVLCKATSCKFRLPACWPMRRRLGWQARTTKEAWERDTAFGGRFSRQPRTRTPRTRTRTPRPRRRTPRTPRTSGTRRTSRRQRLIRAPMRGVFHRRIRVRASSRRDKYLFVLHCLPELPLVQSVPRVDLRALVKAFVTDVIAFVADECGRSTHHPSNVFESLIPGKILCFATAWTQCLVAGLKNMVHWLPEPLACVHV